MNKVLSLFLSWLISIWLHIKAFLRSFPILLPMRQKLYWAKRTYAQYQPVFIISKFLSYVGCRSPRISVALSFGGLLHGTPEDEVYGRELLRAQVDAMSVTQQAAVNHEIAPLTELLLRRALENLDNDRLLRILEIYKSVAPRFRTIFDFSAPVPALSREVLRQRGHSRARLIAYSLPSPAVLCQKRRAVVVAPRGLHKDFLRLADVGPRMVAAMRAYGWHAEFYGIKCEDLKCEEDRVEDCAAIVEFCRQQDADILLIELDQIVLHYKDWGTTLQTHREMIHQLRREKPSLKVVGQLTDAWVRAPQILTEATASLFDLILEGDSPSLPLWNAPFLANKVLHCLQPIAGNYGTVDQPLLPHMLFAGSVAGVSWHRAFWLAAADHLGLPIRRQVSTNSPDGLSALESYALYMRGLKDATCCINFTMRSDQTSIVVGRSFEVILSGSLLVQESTPGMHCYFISGEHYLEFSTLAELSAIVQFIIENPEEAENIRRRGYAFARLHYSDEKLIGFLDDSLYCPT